MRTRSLIPAAVLLIGCGLRHRPVGPEPARGPARDSLLLFDQTRGDSIAQRGAVEGMLAVLASDVVYLRASAPAVYGRESVRALLTASEHPPNEMAWQPLGGGVSYDLRSAYTYGVTARGLGVKSGIRLERYIAYWQRAPSAPWRIVAYAEVGAPPASPLSFSADQTTPPPPPAPERGNAKRPDAAPAVRAADSAFADLADRMGVAFAFSNTVAPNGAVFGGPRLIVGPDAVREYYLAQGTGTSLTWHPVYAVAAGSGDLGFTVGEYVATGRGPSGAAVQRFGKYLTVWERQRDGTWKFVIDGGNPTRAPER
jgi:ketosteroid isomerase-like protein